MINNALFCVLKKIGKDNIDAPQVKKIQELIDIYKRRLPTDTPDSEIAQHALGKFRNELQTEIRDVANLKIKADYLKENLTPNMSRAEIDKVVSDVTLHQHQFVEDNYRYSLGQFLNEASEKVGIEVYNNVSKVDEIAMLNHVFGNSKALNKDIGILAEAIIKTEERINQTYFKMGYAGHIQAPKNTIGMTFDTAKLFDNSFDLNTAVVDIMNNVDIKYLQTNSKAFPKVQGGLKEYIELGIEANQYGTLTVARRLNEYGINTADFKQEFLRNLRINNKDSWQLLTSKYGVGDGNTLLPYMHHLNNTAAVDIARLEYFGSKPNDLLNILKGALDNTKLSQKQKRRMLNVAESNFDYLHGGSDNFSVMDVEIGKNPFTNTPFKPLQLISNLKQTGAMFLTGRASITAALSDGVISSSSLKDVGLKGGNRVRTFNRLTDEKNFLKALGEVREVSAHLAISAGKSNDILNSQIRNLDSTFGSKKVNQFSSWTLRKIGLTGITAINRALNMIEASFQLGELRKSTFDSLDTKLIQSMKKWGIQAEDWDIISKNGITQYKGVNYMNPSVLQEKFPDQAQKLGRWFAELQEKGVPTKSIALQKWKDKMRASGGLSAALAESALTFQGWNGSFWQNHVKGRASDWKLYRDYGLKMTLSGAMVNIIWNGLDGKWEDPATAEFWLKGAATGGFATFFSNFIDSGTRSLQGGTFDVAKVFGDSVASYSIGTGLDLIESAVKNVRKLSNGKDTQVALDLFNIANKFNPASRYYATKFIVDNHFTKPIQQFLGGTTEKKRQARAKRAEKKQNITRFIEGN